MSFLHIVEQAKAFLQRNGRVSLSALKLEFDLDDNRLESLVEELVDVQQIAAREGKVLSWIGPAPTEASAAEPEKRATAEAPQAAEGERRQLTVMFCDLVGSTELSQQLDPEEMRELVRSYQETCVKVVERFDGQIAQYLGDGVLVYFGYPRAHEDDAVRGVSAGRAILGELPQLNERIRERLPAVSGVQVRVGVHTGPVVVGEMGTGEHRETLALGDTVNVAARLLDAADPGSAVISDATRSLVRGVFVLDDLGSKTLKGISDPVRVHRVLQQSGVKSRLDVAAATGLSPLVGREQEISLLLDRWELATEGRGQVVLLGAEAGMGKSRLVQTLREHLADERHSWLETTSSAYHQNSAFYPVIDLIEQALLLSPEDSVDEKVAKVEAALSGADFSLPEVFPVFASLLSIPLPERYPPLSLSPEAQRQRTLESLCAWLFTLAKQQPMIVVAEDLHWIDPSTLELLGRLVDQAPTSSLLLLATFRPGFTSPWPSRSHTVQLTLNPLSRRQVRELVDGITGGKTLPLEVLDEVVAKTDGVPLFVEELTKMVLESGLIEERDGTYQLAGPLPPLAIPTTLQDSLMARLDRLGPNKEVVQLGAVLGREFSYELLEAVTSLEGESLDEALDRLVSAELLYQRGARPRATYTFKHALIQDTAYGSLLKSTRQQHHARVAKTLEERFPKRVEAAPELLAHHYEEAGLLPQGISHYRDAGKRAAERGANHEAIEHLTRGMELLRTLPENRERSRQELELQLTTGSCLVASRGYGHEDVARTFGRARELCRDVDDAPFLSRALTGLCTWSISRAEFDTATELAQEIVVLGERTRDGSIEMTGQTQLGLPLVHQGQFADALEHFDRALSLYDPSSARSSALIYGQDMGTTAHDYSALALLELGYPDRALERVQLAVELARAADHPFSLAFALNLAAMIRLLRRESDHALEQAEELSAVAERQAFATHLGAAEAYRGCAHAASTGGQEGIEVYREGVALTGATGVQSFATLILGFGADAYIAAGQTDKALRAVEAAFTLVERFGERFWEAELYRLKGEILLAMEDHGEGEAEPLLQRALEIARSQQSKLLELRAAMSLARLWQRQGKPGDGGDLLQPVFDWFTEGVDTQDLKDAKALLQELT